MYNKSTKNLQPNNDERDIVMGRILAKFLAHIDLDRLKMLRHPSKRNSSLSESPPSKREQRWVLCVWFSFPFKVTPLVQTPPCTKPGSFPFVKQREVWLIGPKDTNNLPEASTLYTTVQQGLLCVACIIGAKIRPTSAKFPLGRNRKCLLDGKEGRQKSNFSFSH